MVVALAVVGPLPSNKPSSPEKCSEVSWSISSFWQTSLNTSTFLVPEVGCFGRSAFKDVAVPGTHRPNYRHPEVGCGKPNFRKGRATMERKAICEGIDEIIKIFGPFGAARSRLLRVDRWMDVHVL
ncbi:hypothetical protein NDU88_003352 [Pleurodeles waltl]|uniref:Uncharacterized protein n=1 Tax=Pleurodeles waltl TaxID=8319 RepID=A0AAV7P9T3_PLEWA|nr:hypothetical protein NDU88_003352 [Pleurodeles waltl]